MPVSKYFKTLLGLATAIHQWAGSLGDLDAEKRDRIAVYAEKIADTLKRAADALAKLEREPHHRQAAREAFRELGRIEGYIETIVHALRHHLDGRKLAGVKRRLDQLECAGLADNATGQHVRISTDRLAAAEGYFRALADALRA